MKGLALVVLIGLMFISQASAIEIMPISEIKPGMKGYGITVFEGTEPDTFQIEIYDMTYGSYFGAPEKWPLIWARMSGGPPDYPTEKIGPAGGMSGSPIFSQDGRLIGALSCAPAVVMNMDPICGITPAEVMRNGKMGGKPTVSSKGAKIIKTPLYISGLDIKMFEFEGLEPLFDPERFVFLPMSGSNPSADTDGDGMTSTLKPGSAIVTYLIRGDIEIGVIGTVTWIDSTSFRAFGHPFLGKAKTNLEVAQAKVVTTMASYWSSTKLAGEAIGKPFGSIQEDRFWGVRGEIGVPADIISTTLTFQDDEKELRKVECKVAKLPDYTFLLLQIVALDAIYKQFYSQEEPPERGSMLIETELTFKTGQTLKLGQIYGYTGANIYPRPIADFIIIFLGELFKTLSDNDALDQLESVNFNVTFSKEREVLYLREAKFEKTTVYPGEEVPLSLTFVNEDSLYRAKVQIPFVIPKLVKNNQTVEVQVKTGTYIDGGTQPSSSDDAEDNVDGLSKEKELQVLLDELRTQSNTSLFIKAKFPAYLSEEPVTAPVGSIKEAEEATTIQIDSTDRILVWKETRQPKKPEVKPPEITVLLEIRPPIVARIEANGVLELTVDEGKTVTDKPKKSGFKRSLLVFGAVLVVGVITLLTN